MKGSFLIAIGFASGAFGCTGGTVSRGEALYADGYYVEAAEIFERNEYRLNEWPADKRASYGLYRAMTLMQLGDFQGARRWLAYCDWVNQKNPGALPPNSRTVLAQTRAQLDTQQGAVMPNPTAPAGSAIAAKSSDATVAPAPVPPTRKSFAP